MDASDAPVRSRAEIQIAAPPEVAWDVLTRFERWPERNPEVKSMSFDGPLAPGSVFRWKAGPGTIVSTLERVEPVGSVNSVVADFQGIPRLAARGVGRRCCRFDANEEA